MDLVHIAKDTKAILTGFKNSELDCAVIDEIIYNIEKGKINFMVCGEFSAGKSSLINAIIGHQLLPVADIPLTSRQIEIIHAKKPYIKCHWSNSIDEQTQKKVQKTIDDIENSRKTKTEDRVKWITENQELEYHPMSIKNISAFLWAIETASSCITRGNEFCSKVIDKTDTPKQKSQSALKNILSSKHVNMIDKIIIGVSLPCSLHDASFIDVPGEGSINTYLHNAKIAQQSTQIILHVFDAEHIGSRISENILQEYKKYNAHVVYIVNKIDTLNDLALNEALNLLSSKYSIRSLKVSALYENGASLLKKEYCTVKQILDNPKINLQSLILSDRWDFRNIENNRKITEMFLHDASNIEHLRKRIAEEINNRKGSINSFHQGKIELVLCKYKQICLSAISQNNNSIDLIQAKATVNQNEEEIAEIDSFIKRCLTRYDVLFPYFVREGLLDILDETEKALSLSLSRNYNAFEKNVKCAVKKSLIYPAEYRIKQHTDDFYFSIKSDISSFMSQKKINIPSTSNLDFSWSSKDAFYSKVFNQSVSTLSSIIKNKKDKPLLSLFRTKALSEYRTKKRQECLAVWHKDILNIFTEEANKIHACNWIRLDRYFAPIRKRKLLTEYELDGNKMKLHNLELKCSQINFNISFIQSKLDNLLNLLKTNGGCYES